MSECSLRDLINRLENDKSQETNRTKNTTYEMNDIELKSSDLPVKITSAQKGGVFMSATMNYSEIKVEDHHGPKVITVPSNSQITEITNHPKLSDIMKDDLIKLHKLNQPLKELILKDVESCDKTMRHTELDGLRMPFRWNSYTLSDVIVIQRNDPNDFVDACKMYGYTFDNPVDIIDSTNMMMVVLYFAVRNKLNESAVLSELYFYDIIREDKGETIRDMKVRFEQD